MTPNEYLRNIINRESITYGILSEFYNCIQILEPHIRNWANGYLLNTTLSGSYAKGTAIKSGTDLDIFISLSENTPSGLENIYVTLFNYMKKEGYLVKQKNVSIGVTINDFNIDLVPGKRQTPKSDDHSLYNKRRQGWMKTNIAKHVDLISRSGMTDEIKLIKIWRNQNKLDIPSFYLELITLKSLKETLSSSVSENFMRVLEFIKDNAATIRIVDPSNTSNIVSDTLTSLEKEALKRCATRAMAASNWGEIII